MTIVGPDILDGAAVISANTTPTLGKINRYDATSAVRTPPLPALSGVSVGARMIVQRIVTTAVDLGNKVTFTCAGSDTFIDGATTSLVLKIAGEQRELQVVSVSGTKYWKAVGSNTPLSATDIRYGDVASIDHGPFNGVLTQLQHNRSALIQGAGDSALFGNTGNTGGWIGRLADIVGAYFDANVWEFRWDDSGNQTYQPPVVRRTSTAGVREVTTAGAFYMAPQPAGDMEIITDVKPATWNTVAQYLVTKWEDITGNQRGFSFGVNSAGRPFLQWSADGITQAFFVTCGSAVPFANGSPGWVRVTLDVDNGAAGNTVKFYTSTDGVAWSQLGSDAVNSGVTSIFNSSAPYQLASRNTALTGTSLIGYRWVQVKDALSNGKDVVPSLVDKWAQIAPADVVAAGGPLIVVMNGGCPTRRVDYYDDPVRRPKLLSAVLPDVIFIADGHNYSQSPAGDFVRDYETFVHHVQDWRPGVPIIVTTQNPKTTAVLNAAQVQYQKRQTAALATAAESWRGVTVLDTQQAYTDTSTQVGSDGVHPSEPGYDAQARWMAARLAPKTIF
jgi:hypothetical protein